MCKECDAAALPGPVSQSNVPKKLSANEHAVAALPLVMILFGGALGGLCGGAAYALSLSVFKKNIPTPWKYVYSILISCGAVAAYFCAIIALAILFPSLFQKQ